MVQASKTITNTVSCPMQNMTQNTRTLLTKFFGLYCYKTSLGRNIRFVIMNNILPSNVKFNYLFDLKVCSPSPCRSLMAR